MGEEVKAKNEKRRTRAYTRVRWGGFREWRAASRFMDWEMAVNRFLSVLLWIIGVMKMAYGSRNAYFCQSFYES